MRLARRKTCLRCQSNNGLKYYYQNREQQLAKAKAYHWSLRKPLLDAWGHACECCGDTHHEFLTIDHIKNDGKAHRKALTGGTMELYRWLRDRGYPKDGFQLLCWNCNYAKYSQGVCPHEQERRAAQEKDA